MFEHFIDSEDDGSGREEEVDGFEGHDELVSGLGGVGFRHSCFCLCCDYRWFMNRGDLLSRGFVIDCVAFGEKGSGVGCCLGRSAFLRSMLAAFMCLVNGLLHALMAIR